MADAGQISVLRREAGKIGLFAFFHTYMSHLTINPKGGVFKSAPFHKWLCAWIDKAMRPLGSLIGAVPREHAKTTYGTIANVIRCICYKKKRNIGIIAVKQLEANNKLRDIITEIETNPLLRMDFGDAILPAKDAKGQFLCYKDNEVIFANGVRVFAMQVGGKIRGQLHQGARVDLLVFDDPEDDESVESQDQRKKFWNWYTKACLNSLDSNSGSVLWLGTILHHDSILARLLETYPPEEKFKIAAIRKDGSLLWDGYWTMEKLMKRRDKIKRAAFAQEFMNTPIDTEDQVFKPEYWQFYNTDDLHFHAGSWQLPDPHGKPSDGLDLDVYMGVDPAIAQTKGADYFALVVLGVQRGTSNIFLLEAWRGKITFGEQIKRILHTHHRWRCSRVFIEAQGYQQALDQEVWNLGIPTEPIKHHTGKEGRIRAAATHVEGKRLWLPKDNPGADAFMSEAEHFPAADHDDQLDAFTICIQHALHYSEGTTIRLQRRQREKMTVGF